jgi:hypothetical protein
MKPPAAITSRTFSLGKFEHPLVLLALPGLLLHFTGHEVADTPTPFCQ